MYFVNPKLGITSPQGFDFWFVLDNECALEPMTYDEDYKIVGCTTSVEVLDQVSVCRLFTYAGLGFMFIEPKARAGLRTVSQ